MDGMEKVPLAAAPVPPPESNLATSQKSLASLKPDATAPRLMETEVGEPSRNVPTSNIGNTLYFRDGIRRVDYVLAFSESKNKATEAKRAQRRAVFEKRLQEVGIDLEHEPVTNSVDGKTAFVKLHGTWNYLENQAEALKVRMPLNAKDVEIRSKVHGVLERVLKCNPFKLPEKIVPEEPHRFSAVYDRRYVDQFYMKSKDTFFSAAQRSRMIWDTLLRNECGDSGSFGIKQLLSNCTYTAAYPLHDEIYKRNEPQRIPSERQTLFETWAAPLKFYKYQPLSLIRKYFGEKITIYFAWLGFYTKALIPAALAGVICILYGWSSLADDVPSNDICDKSALGMGSTIMCPDGIVTHGSLWNLSDSCLFSKVTYVFDNSATVLFAVFMSIWATMFLEGWKRRQAELAWDWDMHDADMDEEAIRPEYVNGVKTLKYNPVTNEEEPHLPFSSKVMRLIGSFAAVLFFLCLVIAFVFGVIVYRMIMISFFEKVEFPGARARVLTSATAALMNLVIIMLLDFIYQNLAWYLTDWEFPRTEQQFEDSYTFKVFLFQFINYYSSLFYIAFFKGRFSSVADVEGGVGGYPAEACDPAGCMVELLIQLAIIMVGKQFFNNFLEIVWPIIMTRWRRWRMKPIKANLGNTRWEKDYHLNELPPLAMFSEYLEMVLQYGFLTLFVAAFPLAPFFALINNILEVRLDAYKFLGTYRRPMPARAKDLGVWYKILDTISHLAVLSNACVIAFTSDFVPRMLYKHAFSSDTDLNGYIAHSLSYYDTRPTCQQALALNNYTGLQDPNACDSPVCRYKDHRRAPCNLTGLIPDISSLNDCDRGNDYSRSVAWWHVMVARLVFVLVFEHVVFFFKWVMAYIIPDVPSYIVVQMQREQILAKQALQHRAQAHAVAGTSDTVINADIEKGIDAAPAPSAPKKRMVGAKNGSPESGSRDKFRYSPVSSVDSSDDEKPKKKTKLPARRL